MNKKDGEEYPNIGEIVYLLGMGTLLVGTILMPGLGYAAKMIDRAKKDYEWKESERRWKKFNPYVLKRNLKRLRDQKIVEIVEKDGEELVKLTQKGHTTAKECLFNSVSL